MRSWILSASCVLFATQPVQIQQEKLTPQEAFFLRRVTEFWKDHDYRLVKSQISEFLAENESSNIHNNLYALMGDILYQESNYEGALASYQKISEASLIQKTTSRRAQCLYLVGNYDEVIALLTPEIATLDHPEEMQFILADSLFRKMRSVEDRVAQKELAALAKPYLTALFNTSYQDKVLLPLAEIHRELGEQKEGAPLYEMLADKMPLQKEELLLQAAALQLEYDPLVAIATFQKVVDLGGSMAADAAHQEMLLLFQNDRFSDLISRAPKIEMHLAEKNKTLFEFCLARSYFKLDQLPEAIQHYTAFTEKELESTPHKRAAYLTLIHCAQKTENNALFDQVLVHFLNDFPKDEEAGKALLLHAQTALQKGDVAQASTDLNQLLKDFPDFPGQETLLYDQALLLSKTQQWGPSRAAFITYLDKFPATPHSNLIWASVVHASVQELKGAAENSLQEKKEQLAADLSRALTQSNLFAADEEAAYQFLLGQLLYDLHDLSRSVTELSRFCESHPNHPSTPDAYLLLALAHQELKSEPELFIPAAEKALAKAENFTHKTALQLQLFNTYLAIKDYDKAASNLYQTFMVDGTAVQQDNQLWLASYYLKRADHQKAADVFKKVLLVDETSHLNFDPAQTRLEGEVLKFASLLSLAEKENVLRSLAEVQNRHQGLPWKHQGETLLELAQTCLTLEKRDEALETFETILSKEGAAFAGVRNAALLGKSRIQLSQQLSRGDPDSLNDENQVLRSVLSTFKDLQIQKQLSEEPVHLEAALDYVDLRVLLSPEETRAEAALFFLNRVKEDFHSKEDPIAQEYHEERLRFPEKDHLFQTYMKCLEAEILSWESREATEKNDIEKGEQSKKMALELLEEVLQDTQATSYVKHRAEDRANKLR